MILALTLAALAACASEPPPARPVFETIRDSLREGDYGAVYDLLAADEIARRERQTADMREEMSRMEGDAELTAKYERMAQAFRVTIDDLKTMSSRDLFVRGTTVKTAGGLRAWAQAELIGEPKVDGDRCILEVKLPKNRTGALKLVLEEGAWRLVLR